MSLSKAQTKTFLICYQAGARGDFLASILLDKINSVNQNYYKLPVPRSNYIKVHTLDAVGDMYNHLRDNIISKFNSIEEMFSYCKQQGIITIRILPTDLDDYRNIAYFCDVKSQYHYKPSPEYANTFNKSKYSYTNEQELEIQMSKELFDIKHRHLYDYRVFFSELFNIEFIKEFYFKIHNKLVDNITLSYIQNNINLSKRYTEAKYLYE